MIAKPQTNARPLQLNPFAFPSDTDFRFALLIVSVLCASLFIYNALYFSIPITKDSWRSTQLQCEEIRPEFPKDLADFTNPNFLAAFAAYEKCRAPAERANAVWMICGVALLLTVAWLIYWTFPSRKIRRDRLAPLTANDAPDVVDYLVNLCREVKLSRLPIFLWNPLNPASGGLAFGRLGRYYVALTGGLITQFYTDKPAFRAVLLHELAHLRNADVDKTYFAVAVWQAFLIAALFPFLMTIFDNEWGYIFNLVWRVIALAALVYLMRNAVLRTREVYADVRASVWDGPTGALGRVLESLPHSKVGRWRKVLQVHPDPGSRLQVLEDPSRLFPMEVWDAFATGIAAAIALPNVITLLTSLLTGTGLTGLASLGSGLIFAPLAVGVVGLGVWRTTFAALAQGGAPRGAGPLGVGLGFGILSGEILSFTSAIGAGATGVSLKEVLLFNVVWGLLLLVSLLFFMRWIAAGASAWLEVAAPSRSPRLFCALGLTIAGGVLAIWLGLLFHIRSIGVEFIFLVWVLPLDTLWFIVQHPLALLLLISLWAFPLAAWFWHGRVASASGSSWAFLTSSLQQLTLPRLAPFRPGQTLIIGLIGGLIFCGLLLLVRIGLRIGLPEAIRSTDQFRLMLFISQDAVAALMQAGVAAIVAKKVQRLRVLHGLFGAFAAGCLMAVGMLGINLLLGGTINPQSAWITFSQTVNEGALLALPIAWGASALAGSRVKLLTYPSPGQVRPN